MFRSLVYGGWDFKEFNGELKCTNCGHKAGVHYVNPLKYERGCSAKKCSKKKCKVFSQKDKFVLIVENARKKSVE
jgi:hypothetical protein